MTKGKVYTQKVILRSGLLGKLGRGVRFVAGGIVMVVIVLVLAGLELSTFAVRDEKEREKTRRKLSFGV